MKVVLTQNVARVGKRGEVKDVKPGFASNFLLPQGLAVLATKVNITKHTQAEAVKIKEGYKKKESAPDILAHKIRSLSLVFVEKADEKGTFFAGVTRDKIAEALKKYQIIIKPKQIKLSEPIKHAGEFQVGIEMGSKVLAEVNVKTKNEE